MKLIYEQEAETNTNKKNACRLYYTGHPRRLMCLMNLYLTNYCGHFNGILEIKYFWGYGIG